MVYRSERTDEQSIITFEVRDSGIGIAPEQQKLISRLYPSGYFYDS